MIAKCVENAANERRRFQPMAKDISVKIEEKAPIPEPPPVMKTLLFSKSKYLTFIILNFIFYLVPPSTIKF